jgi:hypothetical protein
VGINELVGDFAAHMFVLEKVIISTPPGTQLKCSGLAVDISPAHTMTSHGEAKQYQIIQE